MFLFMKPPPAESIFAINTVTVLSVASHQSIFRGLRYSKGKHTFLFVVVGN